MWPSTQPFPIPGRYDDRVLVSAWHAFVRYHCAVGGAVIRWPQSVISVRAPDPALVDFLCCSLSWVVIQNTD